MGPKSGCHTWSRQNEAIAVAEEIGQSPRTKNTMPINASAVVLWNPCNKSLMLTSNLPKEMKLRELMAPATLFRPTVAALAGKIVSSTIIEKDTPMHNMQKRGLVLGVVAHSSWVLVVWQGKERQLGCQLAALFSEVLVLGPARLYIIRTQAPKIPQYFRDMLNPNLWRLSIFS